MSITSSTRREFLTTASAAAAAAILPGAARGAELPAQTARWPIGSHTRPFQRRFRASQASNPDYVLDAVKAAGFEFADMIGRRRRRRAQRRSRRDPRALQRQRRDAGLPRHRRPPPS